MRKITILFFIVLSISSISEASSYELISSTPISAGLVRNEYMINDGGNHYANVLECDLNNPYIELNVIAGEGKYNQRATVSRMAEITDAKAVTNGDFFNMRLEGTPNGASIIDGDIKSSPCVLQGVYSLGIDQNNTAQILPIGFDGELQTMSGRIFPIDGVNKTYYWYEPDLQYSHQDKLQLYTDFWAASTRGDANNSEILINSDGIVEAISEGRRFNFPVPDGKYILQASGLAMDFVYSYIRVGDYVNLKYNLTPDIDWKFLIGGHGLLVDNNQTLNYTKDLNALEGNRARTAAGISADGKKLYIASVEGRTSRSDGMKLGQLSRFMQAIGSFRAVNLDGGGSTAMVVKQNGVQSRVINPEKNGYERKVVNGIGIFSNAIPGVLTDFNIEGPDTILIGERAYYEIGNPKDGDGNTIDKYSLGYSLYEEGGFGEFNSHYFLALNPGETYINLVTNEGLMNSKKINILDSSYIDSIGVNTSSRRVAPGDSIKYSLIARTNDGRLVDIDPRVSNVSLNGFNGDIDIIDNNLYISDLNGKRSGELGASLGDKYSDNTIYDKNTNIIEMHIGKSEYKVNESNMNMDTELFTSNGRTMVPIRFLVEAIGGEVDWHAESQTVLLYYNGKNIQIPIGSNSINVDGEEIFTDSAALLKDSRSFVPIRFIAEALNMKVGYRPIDERVTIVEENPITNSKTIHMNIGSSKYSINGNEYGMDVELFTENWRTMVPIRFLIEALDGKVEWIGENQIVRLNYQNNDIEIPIGSNTIKVNGKDIKIDSPAILRNSRTFVPIRFIAESLDMKISYRPLDQRVSIFELN
ncbi:MAG: stalk domain-containing protein [Andreesenia angusta]|nr:stalk domain-containing protein [Andreesenia angusta]